MGAKEKGSASKHRRQSLTPARDIGLLPLLGYLDRELGLSPTLASVAEECSTTSLMPAFGETTASTGTTLRGHQGLIKNSRGNGFDVFGIPYGIPGLLIQILCVKAHQPYP